MTLDHLLKTVSSPPLVVVSRNASGTCIFFFFVIESFVYVQHCLHDLWFFSFMRSSLRTLITGMASGSIVAFNIDFNRWHYEHQNRY